VWYPIDEENLPHEPHSGDGANNVQIDLSSPPDLSKSPLSDLVQEERDLDISEALSLGFAPFSLDQNGDHRTIILDYMRYVDILPVRWGVGLRLVLQAWSETATIKGTVALVAAQASLNLAYTRSTFQILGYKGTDLRPPGFGEMTVSNYPDLIKAIDLCRDTIGQCSADDASKFDPKPIAVSLSAPQADAVRPHRGPFHIFHSR
jgi:hypothetical protein